MKQNVMLTTASVLSVLFFSFHLADDIVRAGGSPTSAEVLLRLDADRDRRDRALLRRPLGARTVEPAMAPAPVVNNPNIERPVARRR